MVFEYYFHLLDFKIATSNASNYKQNKQQQPKNMDYGLGGLNLHSKQMSEGVDTNYNANNKNNKYIKNRNRQKF